MSFAQHTHHIYVGICYGGPWDGTKVTHAHTRIVIKLSDGEYRYRDGEWYWEPCK